MTCVGCGPFDDDGACGACCPGFVGAWGIGACGTKDPVVPFCLLRISAVY